MESYEQQIGQVLAALRAEMGLSREKLAAKAGLSSSTILRIERGLNVPDMATVIALAGALDVPLSRLLGEGAAA